MQLSEKNLIIATNNWELVVQIIDDKEAMLYLIITSRMRVGAPKKISHQQYKNITNKRINNFQQNYAEVLKWVAIKEHKPSKNYIKVPLWYFQIPLKNKYELLVAHYYITKIHYASRNYPKFDYDEFCLKYKLKPTRKLKTKFKKHIIYLTNRK
jgi:hypothetical protein